MLNITLDEQHQLAIIEPEGKLTDTDFISAVNIIDPFINDTGKLHGLMIASEGFPGWQDFSAFISHLFFVKEHHKKISSIALVSDMPLANMAEHLVNHFISANIKAFKYHEFANAKQWLIDSH